MSTPEFMKDFNLATNPDLKNLLIKELRIRSFLMTPVITIYPGFPFTRNL